MKVEREPIDGSPLDRLVVIDPQDSDHHEGDQVGFYCHDCGACDETKRQVYHEPGCPHAGRHGRRHYDAFAPDVAARPSPELDASTHLTVITAGETEGRGGLCAGEVLAFECECGARDENAFEIVHDEPCPLAGRHGLTEMSLASTPALRADGGD